MQYSTVIHAMQYNAILVCCRNTLSYVMLCYLRRSPGENGLMKRKRLWVTDSVLILLFLFEVSGKIGNLDELSIYSN